MPQALRGVVLGELRKVEAGGEVIAHAVDNDGADVLGKLRKAVADREDDTVVERVALGRAIEADGQHGAAALHLEQRGSIRSGGLNGVSHRIHFRSCPE